MNRIHLLKTTAREIINLASKSEVLADSKAKVFCKSYLDLKSFYFNENTKLELLSNLCQDHGLKLDKVYKSLSTIANVPTISEFEKNFTHFNHDKINALLKPDYYVLFKSLARVKNGVQTVVKLREDLLEIMETKKDETNKEEFKIMNSQLQNLLNLWFSAGMLQLQRVTWNSPANLVEKIAHFESVHPIRSLSDLKVRLGSARRCFTFTHSTMPDEPLVILHVALTNHLSSNIVTLIKNLENESKIPNIEETATNAIFYSISSCQKGLKGVDLGNTIIKSCVNLLQEEVPTLKHFDTLSPIPGYRKWLNMKLEEVGGNEFLHLNKIFSEADIEKLYKLLSVEHGKYDALKDSLREYLNSDEFKKISFTSTAKLDEAKRALVELANTFLMRSCAFYLYSEKQRGYALNSVANFHLKNGARIGRINQHADMTENGWRNSFALMANYNYVLNVLNKNCLDYLVEKKIPVSESVQQVLDELQSAAQVNK